MRKKAPDPSADPVAARAAVVARVKARRAADTTKSPAAAAALPRTWSQDALREEIIQVLAEMGMPRPEKKTQADSPAATAAGSLGDWVDDRIVATFGSRVVLNDGEQVAFSILESMRGGDPKIVRETVRQVGRDLDGQVQHLVYGVLTTWRSEAGLHAIDVSIAAKSEAENLGWNWPPRRRSRGPETISQLPGKVA